MPSNWRDNLAKKTALAPLCPQCDKPMRERTGPRGTFWGCSGFPSCRGTREMSGKDTSRTDSGPSRPTYPDRKPAKAYDPIPLMAGSEEQEAIWASLLQEDAHAIINAGPGTGKTFSLVQACLRLPKRMSILFVAFNKHIAVEAGGKLLASGCHNVKASTFHSVGYAILRDHFKGLGDPDEGKMKDILETLSPEPPFDKSDWRKSLNLAEKLCGFAKNYLLDHEAAGFEEELEKIADHHNLDTNGVLAAALKLVRPALVECLKRAEVLVDFDDMLWVPVILGLSVPQAYDMVMVDEAQDLSPVQHNMTLLIARGARVVVVGDVRQAIYGWRGAHTESIQTLSKRLWTTGRAVKFFPLTITRRCPRSNVDMARAISSDIRAAEGAPRGDVRVLTEYAAIDTMRPGDLVLCRVNAKLIPAAYALLRRGVKAIIRGRNIGEGLTSLITALEKRVLREKGLPRTTFPYAPTMTELAGALSGYRAEETAKLLPLGDKGLGRLTALREKCDCLVEMIAEASTVADLKSKIERLFAEFDDDGKPNDAVVLGTIHRTKGLEAARVFILAPELIPHPMAASDWEQVQEKNCAWIAITRTKYDVAKEEPGTTVFCGAIPDIYLPKEEPFGSLPHGDARGFALDRELDRQKEKYDIPDFFSENATSGGPGNPNEDEDEEEDDALPF